MGVQNGGGGSLIHSWRISKCMQHFWIAFLIRGKVFHQLGFPVLFLDQKQVLRPDLLSCPTFVATTKCEMEIEKSLKLFFFVKIRKSMHLYWRQDLTKKNIFFGLFILPMQLWSNLFNRPGVAGVVLKILSFRIFQTLHIPNCSSWGAKFLREYSPPLCVRCHMSWVACRVSCIRCHVSGV